MSNSWGGYLLLFSLAVILPVGAVFFFRFLGRIFPVPERCYRLAGSSLRELEKKYRKWDFLGGLVGIAIGGAGGYGSWWLCRTVCAWRATSFTGDFVLVPQKGICLAPAVPAAIALGIAGAWVFLRLLLGERFHELACYSHMKLRLNTNRLLAWMFAVCFVLAVMGTALPLDTYMVASQDGLVYNTFLGFGCHRYTYADIAAVQQKTNVKSRFKKDITVTIRFRDGETWMSGNTQELENDEAIRLAAYVGQRAGITIEQKLTGRM